MDRPYCVDCAWLSDALPGYWCGKRGFCVGREPRTTEACEDFLPRRRFEPALEREVRA